MSLSLVLIVCCIIMNIGNALHELSPEGRKVVRKIENTSRKIINAKASVVFNELCINNNLLPKFTNIRLSSEAVQRRPFTLDFRRNLVLNEIDQKRGDIVRLQEQEGRERIEYRYLPIHEDVRGRIDEALSQELLHHKTVVQNRIQKKLCNLYGG